GAYGGRDRSADAVRAFPGPASGGFRGRTGEPPLRSCQQHQGTTDPPSSLTPPSGRALHGTPRRRPWTSTLTPGRGANDLMNNEPVRLSDPRFTTDLAAFQR